MNQLVDTIWTLPLLLFAITILPSIPLSQYFAWIMQSGYRAVGPLAWLEARLDSGPQNWKQSTVALVVFNTMLFVFGFVVLCLQPIAPLSLLGGKGSRLHFSRISILQSRCPSLGQCPRAGSFREML